MSELSGMTVNERLLVRGSSPEWDAALKRRDRDLMIQLLAHIELADQAESIVDRVIARENHYEAKITALRAAIDEGDASGIVEGDVFAQILAELGLPKKRRAN